MTLELACELAIACGVLVLGRQLRDLRRARRRDLRGLEGLAVEHAAALVRLREALQQEPQQHQHHGTQAAKGATARAKVLAGGAA